MNLFAWILAAANQHLINIVAVVCFQIKKSNNASAVEGRNNVIAHRQLSVLMFSVYNNRAIMPVIATVQFWKIFNPIDSSGEVSLPECIRANVLYGSTATVIRCVSVYWQRR